MEDCNHYDRGDNHCGACGLHLGANVKVGVVAGRCASIAEDLNRLAVPPELRLLANTIYQESGLPTCRGTERKKVVLWALNKAVIQLKAPYSPKQLAVMIGLKSTELAALPAIDMSIEMARQRRGMKTGAGVSITNPLDTLDTYAHAVGIREDEMVKSLHMLSARTMQEHPQLLQYPVAQVAAVLIDNYYTLRFTEEVSINYIAEKVGVAPDAVMNIYNTHLN